MAINIGTDYANTYDSYGDVASDSLKNKISSKDLSGATDDELMEVCQEFESYLVEQMYKAMEKTVMKDEDEESDSYISGYTDYFGDMRIQEYAKLATENNELGIAQMLYDQLKLNVADQIAPAVQPDTGSEMTQDEQPQDGQPV